MRKPIKRSKQASRKIPRVVGRQKSRNQSNSIKTSPNIPPYTRWKPENLNARFPTEADILLGNLVGDVTAIYTDETKYRKAERWKNNYIKSFEQFMDTVMADPEVDADLQDKIDNMYWNIVNMSIEDFLKGQYMYPEELGISVNYDIFNAILTAERIVERWESVLN